MDGGLSHLYLEKRIIMKTVQSIYWGIFIKHSDADKLKHSLSRRIMYPHVTFGFKEDVPKELLGKRTTIVLTGYGIDKDNEAYSVELLPEDEVFFNKEIPHLTTSVSRDGFPKDSYKLNFTPLNEGIKLTGYFGYFGSDNTVYFS